MLKPDPIAGSRPILVRDRVLTQAAPGRKVLS